MTSRVVGTDFTGATAFPHYVNGRLLLAEDLAAGQAGLRAGVQRVGEAAGHGVVRGLWVTAAATTLDVEPGLAIAPSGGTVAVASPVTLSLTVVLPVAAASTGAAFGCCTPPVPPGTGSAIAAGCYLLTVRPATELRDQVAMAATPGASTPPGCSPRWVLEGVQFTAVPLPLDSRVFGVDVTNENRRNLLAHWCFGSERLAALGRDPFAFDPAYGGLDDLDPADLSRTDVPLAVFFWNGQAVQFVDNWSVRRRVVAPDPVGAPWSVLVSDRRRADGEARFLQFQNQAAELVAAGLAGTAMAATTFPILPPVALLPVPVREIRRFLVELKGLAEREQLRDQQAEDAGPVKDDPPRRPMFARSAKEVLQALIRGGLQLPDPATMADPERAVGAAARGFAAVAFPRAAVGFGGVLAWDLVQFALHESWSTASRPFAADTSTEGAFSFYYVLENIGPDQAGRPAAASYVVLIANTQWIAGTRPPFVVDGARR